MDKGLDLNEVWGIFTKHIKAIILVTILFGAIGFCVSNFLIEKRYTANALMYVENKNQLLQSDSYNISSGDITASQQMAATSSIIFKSQRMLERINETLSLSYSDDELSSMIKVQSVDSTQVLQISVESTNPINSFNIAQTIVSYAPELFNSIIEYGSVKLIDSPTLSEKPSFPNNTVFAVIGLLVGFLGAFIVSILSEIMDTSIKQNDDLAELYSIPVFADIPDFGLKPREHSEYSTDYK